MRPAILLLLAIGCSRTPDAPDAAHGNPADDPRSNIAARDYIGPAACGECHPDEHARWSQSLHAKMNARADEPGAVIGDFANATLAYAGGTARFARDAAGAPTMILAKGAQSTTYRVTRAIGHRGLQEYAGIELDAAGAPFSGEEVRLPFGWWPVRAGWYPQPYFDPWLGAESSFDAYAPVREPWAERCPWCHSTYPFAQRIARSSGPRAVGHGLEQYFHSAPAGERLAVEQQVTVAISCESCHLGGRAHAAGAPIQFVPIGAEALPGAPRATTFAIERTDPAIVDAVCAQCHSGPSLRLADHTALRNSSEAIDLAASPCATARCTACHDPHKPDAMGPSTEARAIAACTSAACHASLADSAAATAHAGPGHAASATCLDCHMPRVVMGIDRFVRTHRISSPGKLPLSAAAPNACNLCHLDRTFAWTADALREHWSVRARGTDETAGDAWLSHAATPAVKLIAAHAYAHAPEAIGRAAIPQIRALLEDPLPHVRAWAVLALEGIQHRRIPTSEYDPREIRTRSHEH